MARIAYLIIFTFLSQVIFAQYRSISDQKVIGLRDGLSDRIIVSTKNDTSGNYYIQTPISLHRYRDDLVKETIQLNNYNEHSPIIETEEYFLTIDKDQCITVIDKKHFSISATHCIESVVTGDISIIISSNEKIIVLTQVAFTQYRYYELSADQEKITIISDVKFESTDEVLAVNRISASEIIFINANDELISNQNGILHTHPNQPKYPRSQIPRIYVDQERQQYFFSYRDHEGLFQYNNSEFLKIWDQGFLDVASKDKEGNLMFGLTGNISRHLDNLLLISTDGHLIEMNHLLANNNRILRIHSENFEKSIFFCTYNGLYYYSFYPIGIESFLKKSDIKPGDFGFVIRSFTKGHDQRIKVVKESGNVIYEIKDDKPIENIDFASQFGYGTIWIEYVPKTKTYWVLQYNRDGTSTLTSLHHETRAKKKYALNLAAQRFHITEDNIWITGRLQNNGHIVKLNPKTGSQKHMWKELLKDRNIRASYFTEDYYLFGTRKGLLVYDPKDNVLNNTVIENTKHLSISSIRYYDHEYWIGTYGNGIHILNEQFDSIKTIDIGKTTASNTIASVERDNQGNYWVSTFDGIGILDANLNLINRIDHTNGITNTEFNRDASIQENQYLYFGSLNGYIRIEPKEYFEQANLEDYKVKSLSYELNNQTIFDDEASSTTSISGIPKNITVQYFLNGFTKEERNPQLKKHQIIVQPEPDSILISNNEIKLIGLTNTSYSIELKPALNSNERIVLSNIEISKNYNQLLKYLALAGLIFIGSIIISRIIINRNNERNKEQLALTKELSEVRMTALRSQLNPHFVFNSLNSIQYYIQVNEKVLARNYLAKFARLMRLFLESSQNDLIYLNQEIEQLSLYLELEKMRFEDKWEYEFDVSPTLDTESITIPPMILQPIIENAIIHGLGNLKEEKGLLQIRFKEEESSISIEIEDNGIGREKSKELSKNKLKKHQSLSTTITQERINLFNQRNNGTISINYVDKKDNNDRIAGTLAIIQLNHTSL